MVTYAAYHLNERSGTHLRYRLSNFGIAIIISIFITQYICDNSKNLSRSYYPLVGRGRIYIFLLANIIYHVLLKDCSRLLVTYRTLSRKFENVSVRLLT